MASALQVDDEIQLTSVIPVLSTGIAITRSDGPEAFFVASSEIVGFGELR